MTEKQLDRILAGRREQQTRRVMPLIGPLLDSWEQLPLDLTTDPEIQQFAKQIETIRKEMEE